MRTWTEASVSGEMAVFVDINLFVKKDGELEPEGTRNVSREVKHYNLQIIIAVGFKVNNERAVQFRKWANSIVKDYTIQGWVMDEERLKKRFR